MNPATAKAAEAKKLDVVVLACKSILNASMETRYLKEALRRNGIRHRINVWVAGYTLGRHSTNDPGSRARIDITDVHPYDTDIPKKTDGWIFSFSPGKVPKEYVFLFIPDVPLWRKKAAMDELKICDRTLKMPHREYPTGRENAAFYRLAAAKLKALTENSEASELKKLFHEERE